MPFDVNDMFETAHEEGSISNQSLQILKGSGLAQQVNNAMGKSVDDLIANETLLVTLDIDDSGSIRFVPGNTEEIRKGHNQCRDEVLAGSKSAAAVLMHTRYLNGDVLYPYSPLISVPDMDVQNYNPTGGTPLYDSMLETFAVVLAKVQECIDAAIPCRTVTAIITDGGDTGSYASPSDVKSIVEDMIKAETNIIIGVGVSDNSTDFKSVFKSCGIPEEWVLTPQNTPSEWRKVFGVVSKSSQMMSKTGMTASAISSSSSAGIAGFEWDDENTP